MMLAWMARGPSLTPGALLVTGVKQSRILALILRLEYITRHLGYIQEGCFVRSSLGLCLTQERRKKEDCVKGASLLTEAKLFLPKEAVGFCSVRHKLAHPDC